VELSLRGERDERKKKEKKKGEREKEMMALPCLVRLS
jgi:hypothetical protein